MIISTDVNWFKTSLKRISPAWLWNFLRHHRNIIRDRVANLGSSMCHISYCGFNLCYSAGTILIKKIRGGKIFEEKMCRSIVTELETHAQPIFLDIGANIGLISLYAISKIPTLKVFAFEPGPSQSQQFAQTITENKLCERITLNTSALAEKSGVATFMTHFSPDSSGDGFVDTGRAGAPIPIEVKVLTVDEWWASIKKPRINVVKIDTEGSELMVLKGATTFLSELKPTLYLEIEPKNLRVYPHTRRDILQWLNSHSYNLYTLDGQLCMPENFDSFVGRYDTYIARPR